MKKFNDANNSAVKAWLADMYGLDPSAYETVEDLLAIECPIFPDGLRDAIYIPERFPVRQNMWHLTPGSKLVRTLKNVLTQDGEVGAYAYLLIQDSTIPGKDGLLLVHALSYGPDEIMDFADMRDWEALGEEYEYSVPVTMSAGCHIKYGRETYYLAVEVLQLSSFIPRLKD